MDINLVAESLKFMVLGMGVVFVFLALLVWMMKGQARLIAYLAPPPPAAPPVAPPVDDESSRVAAIVAAVQAFRRDQHTP